MDFIRKYHNICEEISKEEWDSDDDQFQTKYFATFSQSTYKKMEPLVKRVFRNLNGGTDPENELVFISPVTLKSDWDSIMNQHDIHLMRSLKHSGTCSFSETDSAKLDKQNYARNVCFKDGKKTNLTTFLLSRFDGMYITKCIFAGLMYKHENGILDAIAFMRMVNDHLCAYAFLAIDEPPTNEITEQNVNVVKSYLFAPFLKQKESEYDPFDAISKNKDMLSKIPMAHVNFVELLLSVPTRNLVCYQKISGDLYSITAYFDRISPANIEKYLIGFSYNHRWVASQSTRQNWTSCMNLHIKPGYVNHSELVGSGSSLGSFIAYLFDKDAVGKNVMQPSARVLFKPFFEESAVGIIKNGIAPDDFVPEWDNVIWMVDKMYPVEAPVWFKAAAEKIINRAQDFESKAGVFHLPNNRIYRYDLPATTFSSSLKTLADKTRLIKKNPELFSKQSRSAQYTLIATHPELLDIPIVEQTVSNDIDMVMAAIRYIKGDVERLDSLASFQDKAIALITKDKSKSKIDSVIDFVFPINSYAMSSNGNIDEGHIRDLSLSFDETMQCLSPSFVSGNISQLIKGLCANKHFASLSKQTREFVISQFIIWLSAQAPTDEQVVNEIIEYDIDMVIKMYLSGRLGIKNSSAAQIILNYTGFDAAVQLFISNAVVKAIRDNAIKNIFLLMEACGFKCKYPVFCYQIFTLDIDFIAAVSMALHAAYCCGVTTQEFVKNYIKYGFIQERASDFIIYVSICKFSNFTFQNECVKYAKEIVLELERETKTRFSKTTSKDDITASVITMGEIAKYNIKGANEKEIKALIFQAYETTLALAKHSIMEAVMFLSYTDIFESKDRTEMFFSHPNANMNVINKIVSCIAFWPNAKCSLPTSQKNAEMLQDAIYWMIQEFGEFFFWHKIARASRFIMGANFTPFAALRQNNIWLEYADNLSRATQDQFNSIDKETYTKIYEKGGSYDYLLAIRTDIRGIYFEKYTYQKDVFTVPSKGNITITDEDIPGGMRPAPNDAPDSIKISDITMTRDRYTKAVAMMAIWNSKCNDNMNKIDYIWGSPA